RVVLEVLLRRVLKLRRRRVLKTANRRLDVRVHVEGHDRVDVDTLRAHARKPPSSSESGKSGRKKGPGKRVEPCSRGNRGRPLFRASPIRLSRPIGYMV